MTQLLHGMSFVSGCNASMYGFHLPVLASKTLARIISQLLQVAHSIECLTGWYVAVQAEMLVAKADETGEQSELQIAL